MRWNADAHGRGTRDGRVAGLSIEDTDLARPAVQGQGKAVVHRRGGKVMRAAVAAHAPTLLRRSPAFRCWRSAGSPTPSPAPSSTRKTGVDFIFLVGLKSRSDLDAVAAEIRLPIMLGSAPPS
ncbi:MAG: hypothetical protein R3E68_15980 [Burkholderiaceae bacterium]